MNGDLQHEVHDLLVRNKRRTSRCSDDGAMQQHAGESSRRRIRVPTGAPCLPRGSAPPN